MDKVLYFLAGNALVAMVLTIPAALSTWKLRRPALSHALWTLVLLKLITPSFLQLPLPSFSSNSSASVAENVSTQERSMDTFGRGRAFEVAPSLSSAVNGGEGSMEGTTAAANAGMSFASPKGLPFWVKAMLGIECLGSLAYFSLAAARIR